MMTTQSEQSMGRDEISITPGIEEEQCRRKPKPLDIDHIFESVIGGNGLLQYFVFFVLAFSIPPALFFPIFGNAELPHRCRGIPSIEAAISADPNITFQQAARLGGPTQNAGCKRYVGHGKNLSEEGVEGSDYHVTRDK